MYELTFFGNEKCIRQVMDMKEKYVPMVIVRIAMPESIRKELHNSAKGVTLPRDTDELDVRLVIKEHTPLRSEMDKIQDKWEDMHKKIQNTSDDEKGTIYIERLTTWARYELRINQVPYYTLYPKNEREKLSNEERMNLERKESYMKPMWIDNSTWAFQLPYGTWEITCSYEYKTDFEHPHSNQKHNATIAKGKIQLDAAHPVCYLNKKKGLFANIFKGRK